MFKKIIVWSFLIFAVIQLIPINLTNKPVDKKNNFTDINKTPKSIISILQRACYDCHSNETRYPWYAYVAPISWIVKDHVNEGRSYLNFSEWLQYNNHQKITILQHSIATVYEYKMPIPAYIVKHPQAKLTTLERDALIRYFQKILEGKTINK